MRRWFYHIKNLQSTKTFKAKPYAAAKFYHIKNLQSTKTSVVNMALFIRFITLRIYKVLKLWKDTILTIAVLSH